MVEKEGSPTYWHTLISKRSSTLRKLSILLHTVQKIVNAIGLRLNNEKNKILATINNTFPIPLLDIQI